MNQETYLDIVAYYLTRADMAFDEMVRSEALKWASTRGGRSGRVAYQFSRHWIGSRLLERGSVDGVTINDILGGC